MPVGAPPDHRAGTIEGQIARVADIIAYVNHDIDDAVRAGLLRHEDCLPVRHGDSRAELVAADRPHGDRRRGQTLDVDRRRDPHERRRPRRHAGAARLPVRRGIRERHRHRRIRKAAGILGGLWEKVHERPEAFLDAATIEAEGLDAAARDFVAGMTDRYAVRLFEKLFIPAPWVEHRA